MTTSRAYISVPRAPAAPVAWRLDLVRGWDSVMAVAEDWERLHQAHPAPGPWTSWEAIAAVRAVAPWRWEPMLAIASLEGVAGLIVPLAARRRGPLWHLRLFGHSLLPRQEVLLLPGAESIPPAALMRAISHQLRGPALIELKTLCPMAPGTVWLQEGLRDAPGWAIAEGAPDFEIQLSEGWPRVRATLGRTLREAAERGAARGGVEFSIGRADAGDLGPVTALLDREAGGLPRPRSERALAILAERAAVAGRLLLARADRDGRTVAAIAVWLDRGHAAELLSAGERTHADADVAAALRVGLYRHLCEMEGARSLFLPPGVVPAGGVLCSPPLRQVRALGAPQPGLLRVVIGIASWYARENNLGPALIRDALRPFGLD